MNSKKLFLLSLTFIVCKFHAQTSDTCRMKLGMNLFSLSYFQENQQPFTDIMKGCRTWMTQDINGTNDIQNTNILDSIPSDVDGYPLQLPYTVSGQGQQQTVATLITVATFSVGLYPAGNYTVLFDGTGTIQFGRNATATFSVSPSTINVTPSGNGIYLKIISSGVTDHVRNIRILMPGQTQEFNSIFLNKISPFTTLRFMEWNNNNTNTEVQWQNRRAKTFYTQGSQTTMLTKGIAHEYAIRLCNSQQKNCWINVPTQADTNYIIQMATLFRDSLNSNLKIYLEYSNECWNQTWSTNYNWISNYTHYPANVSNYSEKTAWQFKKVFDLWQSVFGSSMSTRVVRVCTGWNSNLGLGYMQTMLNYLNANNSGADAVSVGPYIMPNASDYASLNASCSTVNIDSIINISRRRMLLTLPVIRQFSSMAVANNKQLVFYESGPDIIPGSLTCLQGQNAVRLAQDDPKMYSLYNEWLNILHDSTIATLFNHFVMAGSGVMGSVWNINIPTSQKYRALTDYIDSCQFLSGISENKFDFMSPIVYPNPSEGKINILLPVSSYKKIKPEIYSALGQKVYAEEKEITDGGKIICIENLNLNPGIYFLTFSLNEKKYSAKFSIIK